MDNRPVSNPFSRPLYCMVKPVGDACNMRCAYCYYSNKSAVYAAPERTRLMTEATLDIFTRRYIEAQTAGEIVFTWHGGEATIRPLDFYRKAVELQKRYSDGRPILNCLQTNCTLLDEEWCRFLHDNNWLVGISIDGPADFHDEYRRMAGDRPSHRTVMKAIEMLKRHHVEWNAMAVINDYNADFPEDFYRFFKNMGCRYLQFTPIVERSRGEGSPVEAVDGEGSLTPYSVTPEQWGDFLCRVFDRWVRHDVGQVFVQIFDATLANWVGEMPGLCTLSPSCGHAAVMEYDGEVYSCDHFVFPQYRLGNIADRSLIDMMMSDKQLAFGAVKTKGLPKQCRECRWNFACHGECPKNRFATTPDGEPGLNYLCEGYRKFFAHVAPYMDFMRDCLHRGLPPSLVMKHADAIARR